MKQLSVIILSFIFTFSIFSHDYYVSVNGVDTNPGTFENPFRTLQLAINTIEAGDYIYIMGGLYTEASTINITYGNNGNPNDYKYIFPYNNDSVIFDFTSMTEETSNRGIQVFGNYWFIKGIVIQGAGDNGMMIGGNNNIVENCVFRRNRDTGLQLSRRLSSLTSIADWPSDNMIVSCESYNNSDSDHEDADGFAAKLTSGTGNVFQNCVSHHNIDDGWDLYTKSETGAIGPVTIISCIAHSNGTLTDGSTSGNGDKNGFKLGGEDISVNHVVRRCVAFNNGKHGFTYNRNLGSIEISNCTGYNNEERNFNFDGGTSLFTNNLSYLTGSNDRIIGNDKGANVWDNDDDPLYEISDADFITLTPGPHDYPFSNGFLQLKEGGQLIDKGIIIAEIKYNGAVPDIGALEVGNNGFIQLYTLSITVEGNLGGTVTVAPEQVLYDSGSVITITAVPDEDWNFAGWSGSFSGNQLTADIIMNENKHITAGFITDKLLLTYSSTGPGSVTVEPQQKLYDKGSEVTLTAIPEAGCRFIGWSGDTVTKVNPLNFQMNHNMSVVGMFQQAPSNEIVIQFESDKICYADGKTDNKHTGYMGSGFYDLTNAAGSHIEISVDVAENTNCQVTVRYAHGKTDLRPMEIEVNGITQISSVSFPATGAWTTWDSVSFYINLSYGNNRINFISLGSEGGPNLDQVRLTCADTLISAGLCEDVEPPVVTENYMISLLLNPAQGGTVLMTPSGGQYSEGTIVTLIAIPNEGYIFNGWSNGYISDIDSITLTMNADISLTANFTEAPVYISNNIEKDFSLTIYPNPVTSFVNIEFTGNYNGQAQIFLYHLTGQRFEIFNGNILLHEKYTITLHVSDFTSGLYILELIENGYSKKQKIIIK